MRLVDLRTVAEIKLTGGIISEANANIIADLINLLQRASNLTSLDICRQYSNRRSKLNAENICAMTPSSVKHLTTSINDPEEAKICLERLPHLTTVEFFCPDHKPISDSFIDWLEQNRPNSSHFVSGSHTSIWFGNNSIQPKTIKVANKKMKLIDEHHSS